MQFTGQVRLDGIAAVVAAVRAIPVIGNGDIRRPADAEEMIRRTGCHGVMIGRWALAAPWIFRDTWSFLALTPGTIPPEPTFQEKIELIRTHFRLLAEDRDERVAALEFRKLAPWHSRGLGGPCKMLRLGGQRICNAAQFEELIEEFVAARLTRQ
jgi:tRNA-dihydrouridine synthase